MTTEASSKRRWSQNPKSADFYNNPYPYYENLHSIGGPVYWEEYGFWCLCDFVAVSNALRDRRFARLPPTGHEKPPPPAHLKSFTDVEKHSLLALEPPQHTRLRKCVNNAFVNRQVALMEADIESLANALIDQFEPKNEIELLEHYATPIPVTVIANLLGVPTSECDALLTWSHAMVKVYTLTQTHDEEQIANKAAADFRALLLELINAKRKNPSEDLLSQLIRPGDDELSNDEIISVAVLLLNAGHEATVHQLGNAINTLLTEDWPRDWMHDTNTTDSVVAEAMRFDAPLHLFTRFAQEQIELHPSVVIEKGEEIALLLAAANRDPKRFKHANTFNPHREDGAYVTLGGGIHFCVGASLAKIELRVALRTLFQRLPSLALKNPPNYINSFHFHGLESLNVKW